MPWPPLRSAELGDISISEEENRRFSGGTASSRLIWRIFSGFKIQTIRAKAGTPFTLNIRTFADQNGKGTRFDTLEIRVKGVFARQEFSRKRKSGLRFWLCFAVSRSGGRERTGRRFPTAHLSRGGTKTGGRKGDKGSLFVTQSTKHTQRK